MLSWLFNLIMGGGDVEPSISDADSICAYNGKIEVEGLVSLISSQGLNSKIEIEGLQGKFTC